MGYLLYVFFFFSLKFIRQTSCTFFLEKKFLRKKLINGISRAGILCFVCLNFSGKHPVPFREEICYKIYEIGGKSRKKKQKETKKGEIKRNVRKMEVYFSGMRLSTFTETFKRFFLIVVMPSLGFEMNVCKLQNNLNLSQMIQAAEQSQLLNTVKYGNKKHHV